MRQLVMHLRANLVAYVALFVALGGTSYAAINLPGGSVGTVQLRNGAVTTKKLANGSVTPVKLDSRLLGGQIRHWARIAGDGKITSSSSDARNNGIARDGNYVISWADTFSNRCAVVATSQATGSIFSPSSGYADASIVGAHPTHVVVNTYNTQGQSSPAAFSLVVIC